MLARAIFGDDLFATNAGANNAVPVLFIELFPTWLAALLGVGILAAIMSTADGLVIAMSQVVANDLYRLTIAPRIHSTKSEAEIDRITLKISRFATVVVLAASVALAYATQNMNISLLVALGFGGLSAALWGPLVLGVMWRGLTASGGIAGFVSGGLTFIVIASGFVTTSGAEGSTLYSVTAWIERQTPNAFSVGAIGGLVCILVAVIGIQTDSAAIGRSSQESVRSGLGLWHRDRAFQMSGFRSDSAHLASTTNEVDNTSKVYS